MARDTSSFVEDLVDPRLLRTRLSVEDQLVALLGQVVDAVLHPLAPPVNTNTTRINNKTRNGLARIECEIETPLETPRETLSVHGTMIGTSLTMDWAGVVRRRERGIGNWD